MSADWRSILRGVCPGQYSDRAIRERRARDKRCICPSHASNRGACEVHDELGRPRDRPARFTGEGARDG